VERDRISRTSLLDERLSGGQMQGCTDEDLLTLDPPPSPRSPPFAFSTFSDAERAALPDPTEFVPRNDGASDGDSEDEALLPQYELRLHHPDRAGGTVPARPGGASGGLPSAMQVDELRQFKALCDRLLPGLRTHSHLYTLIHLDDKTHTVTLSEWGEVRHSPCASPGALLPAPASALCRRRAPTLTRCAVIRR
jgi:hypothetical protein